MWWRDREGAEPAVIAEVVDLRGKSVLDVGCGSGRLTGFAAAQAAEVYAFDPDPEGLAEARERVPTSLRDRVTFVLCGAEELDAPPRRFDIALCGWSLWCVPLESVVDALHRIHSAVVPGGVVLDMQPVARRPPVAADGVRLGSLDMREWRLIVDQVAESIDETIAAGLFSEEKGRQYELLETFDDGQELVDTVRDWTGTTISRSLAARAPRATAPLKIHESVRLRVLRVL